MQTAFAFADIKIVEIPAFQQRNRPSFENIPARQNSPSRTCSRLLCQRVSPPACRRPGAAGQCGGTSVSGGLHSRQRTNVFEQVLMEALGALQVVAVQRGVYSKRQQMLDVLESGLRVPEVL